MKVPKLKAYFYWCRDKVGRVALLKMYLLPRQLAPYDMQEVLRTRFKLRKKD